MGIKGSSTRTLILDQAEVPKENLLGEIGKGHVIAFNILNIGRYKLAVGTIGASKRVIELSAAYANQRRQFKTPISSFTLTQEKLATMSARLYAMESSVYRTVGLFEDNMSRLTEEEQKTDAKSRSPSPSTRLNARSTKCAVLKRLITLPTKAFKFTAVTGLCRNMKWSAPIATQESTGFLKAQMKSTA